MKNKILLKILLYIGFSYFFAQAIAHMAGWKIPGLYIYFELPSHMYQDKIISVLGMGWALFYLQAAINPSGQRTIIRVLLASGGLALLGLAIMTLQINFNQLNPQATISLIWWQILILFVYFIGLLIVYKKESRKRRKKKLVCLKRSNL